MTCSAFEGAFENMRSVMMQNVLQYMFGTRYYTFQVWATFGQLNKKLRLIALAKESKSGNHGVLKLVLKAVDRLRSKGHPDTAIATEVRGILTDALQKKQIALLNDLGRVLDHNVAISKGLAQQSTLSLLNASAWKAMAEAAHGTWYNFKTKTTPGSITGSVHKYLKPWRHFGKAICSYPSSLRRHEVG